MVKARKIHALVLFSWALLFLIALPLEAAPVKNATYEEFQDLVKTSAAKIPDLQNLWAWRARNKEPVYFGGGALRGLMQWLEKNLQKHTVAEVKAMQVPSIDGLLIQKDADRDLYHDKVGADWFRSNFREYGGWDVLPKDFREASVEAGGAGIEKVRVAPDTIDDPYGAVKAFYEGKLNYVDPPEEKFKQFRDPNSRLKGNFKSALVMRALRFGNEIPSAEIDQATLATMRKAVESEKSLFVKDNYWMQKSLTKLRKSVKSDEQAIESLSKVGLTQPLAANAYYLGDKKAVGLARSYVFLNAPTEQLSAADLAAFKKNSNRIDLNIAAMEKMLPTAKSPAGFIEMLSPGVENPHEDYRRAIDTLVQKNIDAFEALNPSPEDYSLLRQKIYFLDAEKALLRRQVAMAQNAQELEKAIKNRYPNANDAYKSGYRAAVQELLPGKLERLAQGSTADLQPLKTACDSIDGCVAVMRKQLDLAKTVDEVALAFTPGVENPNDAFVSKINALKAETLAAKARSLPHSALAKDFRKLKSLSPAIDASIEIMREELKRAKTAQEIVDAFHPGIGNPSPAFIERIGALKIERMGKLASNLPENATAQDFAMLKAVSAKIEAGIEIMRAQAARAKTVDDFIKAFDPNLPSANDAYLRQIQSLKDELLPNFLAKLPGHTPIAEFNRLKSISGSIDVCAGITEAQIRRAKTPADFFTALEPGFSNPHEAYQARLSAIREAQIVPFAKSLPKGTSLAELGRLKSATGSIENALAITRLQLDLARTPEDRKIAENIGFANPHPDYRAKHDALIQSRPPVTPPTSGKCMGFFERLVGL